MKHRTVGQFERQSRLSFGRVESLAKRRRLCRQADLRQQHRQTFCDGRIRYAELQQAFGDFGRRGRHLPARQILRPQQVGLFQQPAILVTAILAKVNLRLFQSVFETMLLN